MYRDDVNPTKGGRRIIYLDDVEDDLVESTWYDINPIIGSVFIQGFFEHLLPR